MENYSSPEISNFNDEAADPRFGLVAAALIVAAAAIVVIIMNVVDGPDSGGCGYGYA